MLVSGLFMLQHRQESCSNDLCLSILCKAVTSQEWQYFSDSQEQQEAAAQRQQSQYWQRPPTLISTFLRGLTMLGWFSVSSFIGDQLVTPTGQMLPEQCGAAWLLLL